MKKEKSAQLLLLFLFRICKEKLLHMSSSFTETVFVKFFPVSDKFDKKKLCYLNHCAEQISLKSWILVLNYTKLILLN